MVEKPGSKGVCLFKQNLAIFSTDLTLEGSTFQRIDAATEKPQLPILVLTLGITSK